MDTEVLQEFSIESLITPIASARILLSFFLAILFLQSGLDKILDRKGNMDWLMGHFSKSPLAGKVPLLLTVITIMEVASGVFSALGGIALIMGYSTQLAILGVQFSAISLLMLFFGQRLAKDYDGAATLVGYFLLSMFGLYLFSL